MTLQEDKKALRAAITARREAMPGRDAAGRQIIERITALPVYRAASGVAAYMGFGAEIDTRPFAERVLADGKILALPRIDRAAKALALHRVDSLAGLVPGVWGILEPPATAPGVAVDALDLMLLPGLGFDTGGGRLGYGAGYYDRLLSGAGDRPHRLAAAFDCQVVLRVPMGEADVRMHSLITESRHCEFTP